MNKCMVVGMFAALSAASAMATEPAEPPATPATPATEAATESQKPDVAAELEKAKELRKAADAGDAEAMFDLAVKLATFGPGAQLEDREHLSEWSKLADGKFASQWIMKAADAGSQRAIETACRIGNDPLAPARMRDRGKAKCDELRARHPAK